MICPKCKKEYEDSLTTCPHCGAKRRSGARGQTRRWILLAAAVILLAAVVAFAVKKTTEGATAQAEAEAAAELAQKTVVRCGDFSLTNTELSYYFWSEYFYLLDNGRDQLPSSLDPNQPLDQQAYDEDRSWEDYILEHALNTVENTMSMVFEARETGFALPATYQDSLEQTLTRLEDYALADGFAQRDGQADVQAYLEDSYGPGAELESFRTYLENSYLAAAYSDELYDSPTFSGREVSEYYDQYAADFEAQGIEKDEQRLRSIRAVLVKPEGNDAAAWGDSKAAAETLYATWQAESGDEEDFAALADAHSDDGTAGGLREDLQRDELSSAVADWVFAEERRPGDTEVLRDDQGWMVVYYVGLSERTVWQKAAETALRQETYQNRIRGIADRYTFDVDWNSLQVAVPEGRHDGAAVLPAND